MNGIAASRGKLSVILCMFLGLAAALGVSACGAKDPGADAEDSAPGSVLVLGGAPEASLGEAGDICLDAATGTLYRKTAERGWEKEEYTELAAEGDRVTVTYAGGRRETYELRAAQEPCEEHSFGEIYTIYQPYCVVPGIGIHMCETCGESAAVILPADPDAHLYGADGYCVYCGAKAPFKIVEDAEGDTVTVTGSKEASGRVVIPGEIEGKPVEVEKDAFKGNTEVTSVVIEEGVKTIGDAAFAGTQVAEIELPEGLVSIGAGILEDTPYYAAEENWENGSLINSSYLLDFQESEYTDHDTLKAVSARRARAEESEAFFYRVAEEINLIAAEVFQGTQITTVELSESLAFIGKDAFAGTPLQAVVLPVAGGAVSTEGDPFPEAKLFYRGTRDEWNTSAWKELAESKSVYFYSDSATGEDDLWHVGNDAPVIWPVLTGIEADASGATTEFHVGSEFNHAGLVVRLVYNDGKKEETKDYTVSEPTMSEVGAQTVTVTYDPNEEFTATYEITITDHHYGDPAWSWTESAESGYTSAAATFTCDVGSCSHTERVADGELDEETEPATCDQPGKTTYTASVSFGGKEYSATQEVEIPKILPKTFLEGTAQDALEHAGAWYYSGAYVDNNFADDVTDTSFSLQFTAGAALEIFFKNPNNAAGTDYTLSFELELELDLFYGTEAECTVYVNGLMGIMQSPWQGFEIEYTERADEPSLWLMIMFSCDVEGTIAVSELRWQAAPASGMAALLPHSCGEQPEAEGRKKPARRK